MMFHMWNLSEEISAILLKPKSVILNSVNVSKYLFYFDRQHNRLLLLFAPRDCSHLIPEVFSTCAYIIFSSIPSP